MVICKPVRRPEREAGACNPEVQLQICFRLCKCGAAGRQACDEPTLHQLPSLVRALQYFLMPPQPTAGRPPTAIQRLCILVPSWPQKPGPLPLCGPQRRPYVRTACWGGTRLSDSAHLRRRMPSVDAEG